MKRSLILCAVISTVAGLLGWREIQQLSTKRAANAELVKEASANSGNGAQAPGIVEQRREYPVMKERVKAIASDYFALLRNDGGVSAEELATLRENIKSRLEELVFRLRRNVRFDLAG